MTMMTMGAPRRPSNNGDGTPGEEDEETVREDDSNSNEGTPEKEFARVELEEEERSARKDKEMKKNLAVSARGRRKSGWTASRRGWRTRRIRSPTAI